MKQIVEWSGIHLPLQFSHRPMTHVTSAWGWFNLNQLLLFPPRLADQMEFAGLCSTVAIS